MKKYTYTDNGFTFERITKKKAKAAYDNGLYVILCPCNLRPGGVWHPEVRIIKTDDRTFASVVNEFEYYSAINDETGRKAAFYIPVKMTDEFTGDIPSHNTIKTLKEYDYAFMEA